jgi:ABC-type sugar transport system ATPase subunit
MKRAMQNLLTVTNVDKTFPGVHALKKVSLFIRKGEVHALVGENGAGKSTLMNILSGIHKKDSGSILFNGSEMDVSRPLDSQLLGISIIHQELNLVPHFSIAENIFVGREKRRGRFFLNKRRTVEDAKALLLRVGLDLDPETPVLHLSIAQRQLVEVAKALAIHAQLIVMDEPTSSLSEAEIKRLLDIIRELRASGVSVVFISHKLEEVFSIADRITVIRDGEIVRTVDAKACTQSDLIEMMVGRAITEIYPKRENEIGEVVFEVKGFSRRGKFSGVSFSLRRGEILGISGLVGSGRSEVLQAIFGSDEKDSGEVFIAGAKVEIRSPQDAIRCGMGLVPEDRKLKGLFLGMAVRANVSIASLGKVSRYGVFDFGKERAVVASFIQKLSIRVKDDTQKALHLSGGNQQKVVLSKWFAIQPRVLFVDEPTRGVDVGAKKEIYTLLRGLAQEGVSIVMVSSELPEILGMSDRIIVMHQGTIRGEVLQEQATQQLLLSMSLAKDSVHTA